MSKKNRSRLGEPGHSLTDPNVQPKSFPAAEPAPAPVQAAPIPEAPKEPEPEPQVKQLPKNSAYVMEVPLGTSLEQAMATAWHQFCRGPRKGEALTFEVSGVAITLTPTS